MAERMNDGDRVEIKDASGTVEIDAIGDAHVARAYEAEVLEIVEIAASHVGVTGVDSVARAREHDVDTGAESEVRPFL